VDQPAGHEHVGFIGVGTMGGEIVAQLLSQGIPVLAWDTNPTALAAVTERGAHAATSVKEVADRCDVVFASLPSPDICRAVALGPDGVGSGHRVKVYLETSTLGGETIAAIAQGLETQGVMVLDTPVVGGTWAVREGNVGVLVAGPEAAFTRARFALDAFAGRLFYLGPRPGQAQAAKVINNAVAYAHVLSTCEAVALGMASGLSMESALAIINQGSGANFFSQRAFPATIQQGIYQSGPISNVLKDLACFLDEAASLGMNTPVAEAIADIMHKVVATGSLQRDTMTIFHYFTDLAHLPRQG